METVSEAMIEYQAMKREMNERVKSYYARQNKKRQWIVDATTVIEQEVVVYADTREEAIEQAKKDIANNKKNVYSDIKSSDILDIIEVQRNGI